MCACNQSLDSIPCSKDVWNRKVIAGVSSSASSFKYLACMFSGPVALWGLMFLSNLYTPFSVIVIFCIAEYGAGPLCGMFVWSSCVYTDLNVRLVFLRCLLFHCVGILGCLLMGIYLMHLVFCSWYSCKIVYCWLLALDWWCRISTCYVPFWWFLR